MKSITLMCVIGMFSVSCYSQEKDEYVELVRSMFDLQGTMETYEMYVNQILDLYADAYMQSDTDIIEDLRKEFLSTSLDEFAVMAADIYKKYLTIEDLRAVIAFYESPAGKRFTAVMPAIAEESMAVGEAWGRNLSERVIQRMTGSEE